MHTDTHPKRKRGEKPPMSKREVAFVIGIIILSFAFSTTVAQEATPTMDSNANTQIAFVDNLHIYVMSYPDASTATQVTSVEPGPSNHPTWSPDGNYLAFDAIQIPPTSSSANTDIFVVNVDTQETINLTNTSSNEMYPVWSPNGDLIAFVSDRDGNREIYVMDVDGENQRRVTHHEADDGRYGLAWSPDGRFLAFISRRDEGRNTLTEYYEYENIYVIDMNDFMAGNTHAAVVNVTAQIDLCPAGEFYRNLAWSVNNQLAFAMGCSASWDIYIMDVPLPLEGEDVPILTNLSQSPREDGVLGLDWSPDGNMIVFVANPNVDAINNLEIFVIDVDETLERNEPQIWQLTSSPTIRSFYASPRWATSR